jgi:hypothetical protein
MRIFSKVNQFITVLFYFREDDVAFTRVIFTGTFVQKVLI